MVLSWGANCFENCKYGYNQSGQKHTLPSSNIWAYSASYKAVYESSKLHKEDLVGLCCRAMHCVRLIHTTHGEDDGLYAIFAGYMGQDVTFMGHWVYYFITDVYQTHYKCIGFNYLMKKGLDLDMWAEAIQGGQRPDFFVLFALSALLEIHTVVCGQHLRTHW